MKSLGGMLSLVTEDLQEGESVGYLCTDSSNDNMSTKIGRVNCRASRCETYL